MVLNPRPYRSRRHRKFRRRAARFRALGWLALAILAATVGALVAELSLPSDIAPSGVLRRLTPPQKSETVDPEASSGPGTVFRHSVIPGGVQTGAQLQAAIDSDPVVAEHHADVTPSRMRPETLSADRLVYMSYRKGDEVYWTRRKVLLRRGEKVLSDGENDIRARCGNGMSFEPMLPTEDAEPDPEEFEQVVSPPTLIASRTFVNDTLRGLSGEIRDSLLFPDPSGGLFVPPLGGTNRPDTLWFVLDPGHLSDSPAHLVESTSVDGSDAVSLDEILDPGGDLPSALDEDPSTPPVPLLPEDPPLGLPDGDPIPLILDDPLEDPIPAPEPATLLLVGGGISALLARRRMSRGR